GASARPAPPAPAAVQIEPDAHRRTPALCRHGATLASVAIALSSAGRSWRKEVDETLAKAQAAQRKRLKSVGHWRKKKPR
ncbi:MAG TPA: hypothetical protein VEQ85_03115, partial [Lacipirellulaceae bacterium]|nr:hypothetical protein [Lacipirellulaceae bacterium]